MIRARLEVNAGVLTLGADRDTLLTATCQANKPTHSRGNTVTPVMVFFFLLETPKASNDMMSTTEWKKTDGAVINQNDFAVKIIFQFRVVKSVFAVPVGASIRLWVE